MATFFMFGRYSPRALQGISGERTEMAKQLITEAGGEIKAMYALLGEYDLAFILELPGVEEAMKVSTGLSRLTHVSFTSCQAVSVETFDTLAQ